MAPNHVFRYGRLGDLDTQFEQFTMDPWNTPKRICAAHGSDQIANLSRDRWPARLAVADLPAPEEAKALPVPPDDGFRLDDHQGGSPVHPNSRKPGPEEPISCGEPQALGRRATQDAKLLPQGEVLEPECSRVLEQGRDGGE